jgi:hypothetical protein
MKFEEWYEKFVLPTKPESAIINVKTASGAVVKKVKGHFFDRLEERGFVVEDIINALQEPLHITDVKYNKHNQPSVQFIGEKVTAAFNPDTDTVVTGWKTGRARIKKYKR